MPFIDIVAWAIIALGTLYAIPGVAALVASRTRANQRPAGAHAKPPMTAGAASRELRTSLVMVASGVVFLSAVSRDNAAKRLVGIVLAMIVIWELGSWLTSTSPSTTTTSPRDWDRLVLPAVTALYVLASGWKYAKWMLSLVLLLIVAPGLHSWIRSRINRPPPDPTSEPR